MNCKKILIISPAFAPCTLVGAARMTSLVDYLIKKNYKVTVVCYGRWMFKGNLWTRKIPSGAKIIEISETKKIRFSLFMGVISELIHEKYDVCITSMGPFYGQLFMWFISALFNLPYILDYRDLWFEDGDMKKNVHDLLVRGIEKLSIKHSSAVVFVTEGNLEIMKSRVKKYSSKMYTIYNGCENMEGFQNVRKQQEGYCICCVGKYLYYDKNAAVALLESINCLRKQGVNIRLFHIGEESDSAADILREYNLDTDCYCFLGEKSYEDSMSILSGMDAAVIIYRHETGLGTKVFDYIGLNKPIIYVGKVPSELSRFITQFENYIIDDSVESLTDKLGDFVSNNVIKLNREVENFYTRDCQNKEYEVLIDDVIQRGKSK